jgi:hypothetical protein
MAIAIEVLQVAFIIVTATALVYESKKETTTSENLRLRNGRI